ncbi:hypothetical protein ACJX0J_033125, partial [Zea mays]
MHLHKTKSGFLGRSIPLAVELTLLLYEELMVTVNRISGFGVEDVIQHLPAYSYNFLLVQIGSKIPEKRGTGKRGGKKQVRDRRA